MARENIAAGLMAAGAGLRDLAGVRMEREARDLDALRQQSLENLRHQHSMEESTLSATMGATFAAASETRRQQFETSRDTATQKFQQSEREAGQGFQSELVTRQENLQENRFDREDRRRIEDEATTQLSALTKRINEITDAQREGKYLDPAAAQSAQDELDLAHDQARSIRARTMRSLKDLNDPRYKDMSLRDILVSAGYSREELATQLRDQAAASLGTPTNGAPTPGAPASPAAPSSPAPLAAPGAAPLSTSAPSTSAPGRAALAPPQSPPPLADMGKEGRAKKAKGGAGTEAGFADEARTLAELGTALKTKPWLYRRNPEARAKAGLPPLGGNQAPESPVPLPPEPTKGKMPNTPENTIAREVLRKLRAGESLGNVKLEAVTSRAPADLRALGFTDAEINQLMQARRGKAR